MVATHPLNEVSSEQKCRYKTGKCYNTRSSKRNGQPHQLCAYHRDKANRIQRKFDRQKRQSERSIRHSMNTTDIPSTSYCPVFPMVDGKVPAFGTLLTSDVDMYSDSESNRSSFGSEASGFDVVWNDIRRSSFPSSLLPEPYSTNVERNPFVPEEIDFLCNVMFE